MDADNTSFVFFPYLKTTEPVHYRDIEIKNCNDLSNIPESFIEHIQTLSSIFYLNNFLRIQNPSCAFLEQEKNFGQFFKQIFEFQTLIRYFYSSPHPIFGNPFLMYEHGSVFIFRPASISKYLLIPDHEVVILPEAEKLVFDSRDETPGYEGQLNRETLFWVAKGSQLFPPTPGLWLNISQDISRDLGYFSSQSRYISVFEYFSTRKENDELAERILTALDWYNKSAMIRGDESNSLIHLAIAFESLLGLEKGEKVTDRFNESVKVLVGDIPRLDSWLTQFYNARSDIIHEGKTQNIMFKATDDQKKSSTYPELEYRSLVSYGRQVFRVCVTAKVTGAMLADDLKLASLLVTNQQRFERICEKLSKDVNKTPNERILATEKDVSEIDTYRFVGEKGLKTPQLLGTAKLMVQQYLLTNPNENPELMKRLSDFAEQKKDDQFKIMSSFRAIHEFFSKENRTSSSPTAISRSILITLVENVWHYTFSEYYQLLKKNMPNEPTDT